jgi:hypothetical protein
VLDRKTKVKLALDVVDRLSDPDLDYDATNLILRTYDLDTPGRAVIGDDIDTYVAYLNEQDVEAKQRQEAAFFEERAARTT